MFSIYSLISILIIFSSDSNKRFAKDFAKYVLPTPVAPTKIKLPIGLLPNETPALDLFMAFVTLSIAVPCPITIFSNYLIMTNTFGSL